MKDLSFNPFTLADKELINDMLQNSNPNCLSIYSFASLISWSKIYHNKWALLNNDTLIITGHSGNGTIYILEPKGIFSKQSSELLLEKLKQLPQTPQIFGVSQRFLDNHPAFTSHFDIKYMRNMANYIYMASDLALLKGRKFQTKRNLIHQFEHNYTYTLEHVSAQNIGLCKNILTAVEQETGISDDANLINEKTVLDFTLEHFAALDQKGLLVYIDDTPAAFSIYEELSPQVTVVHFEKALRRYKGLYQFINRETAKEVMNAGYNFINREEDLNIIGLRQAKMSYNPIDLCPAYVLTLKN